MGLSKHCRAQTVLGRLLKGHWETCNVHSAPGGPCLHFSAIKECAYLGDGSLLGSCGTHPLTAIPLGCLPAASSTYSPLRTMLSVLMRQRNTATTSNHHVYACIFAAHIWCLALAASSTYSPFGRRLPMLMMRMRLSTSLSMLRATPGY